MSEIVSGRAGWRRLPFRATDLPATLVGTVSLGAAQVCVAIVFAAASLLLVRSLPTEEFGRVAFGLNAHMLLLTLFGFGLSTGVMAESVGDGRGEVAAANVRVLFELRLLTLLPLVAVAAVWSALAGDIVPALAGVAASVYVVQDFLVGILAGQLRARSAAAVIVIQPVTYFGLLLGIGAHSAEQVLALLIVAIVVSLAAAAYLAVPGGRRITLAAVSLAPLRASFGLAGYAYLLTLVNVGFMVLPVLVLGTLGRYAEAATLSIVLTLARFMPESLSLVTAAVYFPRLKALASMREPAWRLFDTFGRLLGLAAIPAGIALALLGGLALNTLFGGRYDYLAPDLSIASLLVWTIPFDALLSWTLLARGGGRVALVAAATRLAIILGACGALVLTHQAGALALLVVAYPVAVTASLLIQLFAVLRRRRSDRASATHLAAA